jgi:non-specific protein-tyrosine kinase
MAADTARSGEQPPGIREFLAILWLRKWTLILVTVVVVGIALAYSLRQTPIYQSTAEVLVRPVSFDPSQPGVGFVNMETEKRVAESAPVARAAEIRLRRTDTKPGKVEVETTQDVETLAFTASSPQPTAARRTAQAYAEAYIQVRGQTVLRDLQAARQPIEAEIDRLNRRIAAVESELFAPGTTRAEKATLNLEYSNLLSQRGAQQAALDSLVSPESVQVADILQPAEFPTEPASPNHLQTGLFALFVGLSLGVGLVFLRDRLDQSVRDREALETTAGLPVLGAIPRRARSHGEPRVVPLTGASTESSEGYKALRTSLVVASARDGWKTIMMTSATPGEGKTSTVANLGVALAQAGKQVILVSADLRRPELHRYFSVPDRLGLRDLLSTARDRRTPTPPVEFISGAMLKEALMRVDGLQNLLILGSGSARGDPPELLGSEAMKDLVAWLRGSADFVLIDTPPVLGMADTMSLAPLVDGVMLVASAGDVSQAALRESLYRLEGVEARVIGAVLNKYDPSRSRDYYSSYYYNRPRHGFGARGERRSGLRAIDGMAGEGASSTQNAPQ